MEQTQLAQVATPLCQIEQRLTRTEQVGSASETFDAALLAGEVLIKWSTSTALSLLRVKDPGRADWLAQQVVRADSLGGWLPVLRQALKSLHRAHSTGSRTWAAALTGRVLERTASQDVTQALEGFRHVIRVLDEADYTGLDRGRHSFLDLMSDLVFIRNRTRGHGAQTAEFFDECAPPLATAVRSLIIALPVEAVWYLRSPRDEQQSELVEAIPLVGTDPLFGFETNTGDKGTAQIQVRTQEVECELERVAGVEHDAGLSFVFANGRWNDAQAICQFVDYSTGRTLFLQPGYATPDLDLLPSETTARDALVWLDHIAHNLPPQPADFVNRPMLEAQLRTLLTDRQHRLITLRGGGGMGKTALALHALWEFVEAGEPFGYDFVLWFSARDIDLLESGPKERLRDVGDVDDVAESFAQLMADEQLVGQDAVSYMVDQVSDTDGGPSYLIVLDNLETFESPARIQRVLDESVVLPSKVLLTSRHEEFRGDYPIEVSGMEETEADRLMVEEARRHYAEPRVDRKVRNKIAAATGSRAYAMKLAVAQIGQGLSPEEVTRSIPIRSDLLAALFDRSFEQLSEDGRFLYLMLGAVGRSVPELALKAIATVHGHDYDAGASALVALSLVSRDDADAAYRHLRLTEMAYRHAKTELIGDPDELRIRALSREFREWITPRGTLTDAEAFASSVIEAATSAPRATGLGVSELLRLTEELAEDYPSLWPQVAAALDTAGSDYAERARTAYRRSAEQAEVDDPLPWQRWSDFERRSGDDFQALVKSIRAVETDATPVSYCSQVAFNLSEYISGHKQDIPVTRRSFLVSSVRVTLEDHDRGGRLDATALSRLGWLYLIEYSPMSNPDEALVEKARYCARRGLELDPGNYHCQGLLNRTA